MYRPKHFLQLKKKQKAGTVVLTLSGLVLSLLSQQYTPPIYAMPEQSVPASEADAAPAASVTPTPTAREEGKHFARIQSALAEIEGQEDEAVFEAAADKLNLAYFYAEGADDSDVLNSYAGEVYRELMMEDSRYIANLFELSDIRPLDMARRLGIPTGRVLGKYNPDVAEQSKDNPATWFVPNFRRVNLLFYNADGARTDEYSNVKEIMAMASVYCYQHDYLDNETFEAICRALYAHAHSYQITIGDVYYDKGCIHRSAAEEGEEAEKEEAEEAERAEEPFSRMGDEENRTDGLTEEGIENDTAEEEGIWFGRGESALNAGTEERGPAMYIGRESTAGTSGDEEEESIEAREASESGDTAEHTAGSGTVESTIESTKESRDAEGTTAESHTSVAIEPKPTEESTSVENGSNASVGMVSENTESTAAGTEKETIVSIDTINTTAYEVTANTVWEAQAEGSANGFIYKIEQAEETDESIQPIEDSVSTEAAEDETIEAIDRSTTDNPNAADSKAENPNVGHADESTITSTGAGNAESTEAERPSLLDDSEGSGNGTSTQGQRLPLDGETEGQTENGPGYNENLLNSMDASEGQDNDETIPPLSDPDAENAANEGEGEGAEGEQDSARSDGTAGNGKEKSRSDGSASTAEEDDPDSKNYCPGHVDLYVRIILSGFDDANGLRNVDLDQIAEKGRIAKGQAVSSRTEGGTAWAWTPENIAAVHSLVSQDWFKTYGLSVSSLNPKTPLSSEEISAYLDKLPASISSERRRLVEYALGSVGKIPYYWGGKASRAGYEGNAFGTVTEADHRGRILKGLDCSGWIQWVYWSALGNTLGHVGSTGTLVGIGEKIHRADLQPGDIIIRTGDESHVVMFLEWVGNGNMIAIHENATSNNVSVNEVTANYPYYRRLIQ